MKTNVFRNIPIGVLLIAAFYVFGAFVLLIGLITNPAGVRETIAAAHGLSPVIGQEFVVAVAALALIMAYGMISLSRWGFFLAIAYSLYVGLVGLFMGGLRFSGPDQPATQIYFGNMIWSTLVVVYLIIVRRRFFARPLVQQDL